VPQRLIRVGIVDSRQVCALSDWAWRVYLLLVITADDAGRHDARPRVLFNKVCPDGLEGRAEGDVVAAVHELAAADLVLGYDIDGAPFLQLGKTSRATPTQRSYFPGPSGSFRIEWVSKDSREAKVTWVKDSLFEKGSTPPSWGVKPMANPPRRVAEGLPLSKGSSRVTEGIANPSDPFGPVFTESGSYPESGSKEKEGHADGPDAAVPSIGKESPPSGQAHPRQRRPPETGPIATYRAAFLERFGVEPDITKADALVANQLPKDEADELIRAYVADDDPWIDERGHALRHLKGQINRLRLKRNGNGHKVAGPTPAQVRGLAGQHAPQPKPKRDPLGDGAPPWVKVITGMMSRGEEVSDEATDAWTRWKAGENVEAP
jgi:hypothetical protein